MAKQINRAKQDQGTKRSNVRGWLTWWTISQAERIEKDLKAAAANSKIPQWMIDRIAGRTAKSAWTEATQLGAKGKPSATLAGDPKGTARYLTRDVNDGVRAIVREVFNRDEERVGSETVAQVYLINDKLQFNILSGDPAVEAETRRVVTDMTDRMLALVGQVDDGRIRATILTWLERNHRICVRGTGGVYFVPRPSDDGIAQAIEDELVTIRAWVNDAPINSLFSIVEVSEGGATSMDAFKATAVEELQGELAEVLANLDKWQANTKMNAGSMAYSTDTMVLRVDAIGEKTAYLVDALGEEIAVVQALAEQVRKRAMAMRDAATEEVTTYRAAKAPTPKPTTAAMTPEDLAKGTEELDAMLAEAPKKKTGTARSRAAKQVVG